jgi:hypothetical protein
LPVLDFVHLLSLNGLAGLLQNLVLAAAAVSALESQGEGNLLRCQWERLFGN